jgi:hypothetical protein
MVCVDMEKLGAVTRKDQTRGRGGRRGAPLSEHSSIFHTGSSPFFLCGARHFIRGGADVDTPTRRGHDYGRTPQRTPRAQPLKEEPPNLGVSVAGNPSKHVCGLTVQRWRRCSFRDRCNHMYVWECSRCTDAPHGCGCGLGNLDDKLHNAALHTVRRRLFSSQHRLSRVYYHRRPPSHKNT